MCNAGAVIHSHGIESCLVTMLNPLSKEFRVSFLFLVCLSSNKFYLFANVLKWLAFLQLVLPTAFSHFISFFDLVMLVGKFADHSHGNDKGNQRAWLL